MEFCSGTPKFPRERVDLSADPPPHRSRKSSSIRFAAYKSILSSESPRAMWWPKARHCWARARRSLEVVKSGPEVTKGRARNVTAASAKVVFLQLSRGHPVPPLKTLVSRLSPGPFGLLCRGKRHTRNLSRRSRGCTPYPGVILRLRTTAFQVLQWLMRFQDSGKSLDTV